MATDEVRRLEELEKENERLERIVADPTLDELILTEAARGHGPARPGAGRPWPASGRPSMCRNAGRAAPWGGTGRGFATGRRPTPTGRRW